MTSQIKPIFTADINNPEEVELLKKYFGADAIDKAFDEGDGHQTLLENAEKARIEQLEMLERNRRLLAMREYDRQLRAMQEEQAAIRRQTRKPKEPKITGTQMSLF